MCGFWQHSHFTWVGRSNLTLQDKCIKLAKAGHTWILFFSPISRWADQKQLNGFHHPHKWGGWRNPPCYGIVFWQWGLFCRQNTLISAPAYWHFSLSVFSAASIEGNICKKHVREIIKFLWNRKCHRCIEIWSVPADLTEFWSIYIWPA